MKKLIVCATVLTSISAFAQNKVIYGQDNRVDVYQASNSTLRTVVRANAGMVPKKLFVKADQGGRVFNINRFLTLERGQNVCTSEKFSQQPLAPICSGFLVSPDTLVTAGHCYIQQGSTPEAACQNFVWLFDYEMKSASHDPTKNIPINNIYFCKKVMAAQRDNTMDFAIIKLDRPVVGRPFLKVRTAGKIADNAMLAVVGHPSGLPTKIAAGGRITYNVEATRFSTTLDTFHGNSGSAVVNDQGGVEGILIMGKNDYRPSIKGNPGSCQVVNVCNEQAANCSAGPDQGLMSKGEAVLRIQTIATLIAKAVATKL